jgi:HSP20 family molecular chaperone IbpA
MLYTTRLINKVIDNSFTFPYTVETFHNGLAYDEVKTETDGTIKINVIVPGFSKEQLSLTVKENTLCLKSKEGNKINKYWKIGNNDDIDKITAECKNGILTISIPAKPKVDNTKNITIY